MKFMKNNLCTVLMLALFFCVVMTGTASAAAGDHTVFDTATQKATLLFKNSKSVLFILGGFGLMALAFQAIFGKLKWAWFATLAFGLAVVSAAGSVIDYATDTDEHISSNLSDTLGTLNN